MDQQQLEAVMSEWQKRLRLQDWRLKIRMSRARDMSFQPAAAEIRWDKFMKTATISITDPLDWDENMHGPRDIEQDIIHELIHLLYLPFDDTKPNTPEWVALEQSINMLTDALIGLKRESEGAAHGTEKEPDETQEGEHAETHATESQESA